MNINQENNTRINHWFGESVLVKISLIGMLTLLLLIPSSWIQDVISERQQRQNEVIEEISDKWSGSQLIEGPILVLPYIKNIAEKNDNGTINYIEETHHIYILPETLNVNTDVKPELLHRGIFETVVYNSMINVDGKFSSLELKKSGINLEMIQWDKVKMAIGLSDLKGLKNNPIIELDGKNYEVEPDFTDIKLFNNNLIIQTDLNESKNTSIPFTFKLDIRGSSELNFLHLGKTTNVKMKGLWNNPSFVGRYLPDERTISDIEFNATWKMPYFNRSFPQQWIEKDATLITKIANTNSNNNEAVFGVRFISAVDQYQKTMRTAKYSILIILLTFISLFFTELLTKKKVHLLQYVLIGASMTIYYTLLLSFSEQIGFNKAYLIASVATIILIVLFLTSLLKSKKPAIIFGIILSILYGFIFIIIQLQDLSLLFGSIGLFIIIAVMMYLSSKLNWETKSASNL
jgi:inner membrane protein